MQSEQIYLLSSSFYKNTEWDIVTHIWIHILEYFKAYYNIDLDEESMLLTTFNTI